MWRPGKYVGKQYRVFGTPLLASVTGQVNGSPSRMRLTLRMLRRLDPRYMCALLEEAPVSPEIEGLVVGPGWRTEGTTLRYADFKSNGKTVWVQTSKRDPIAPIITPWSDENEDVVHRELEGLRVQIVGLNEKEADTFLTFGLLWGQVST